MKRKMFLSQLPFHLAFLFLPQQMFLDLKQWTENECFNSFSTFNFLEFLGMKNLDDTFFSFSLIVSTQICRPSIFLADNFTSTEKLVFFVKKSVPVLAILVLSNFGFYKSKWKSFQFPLDHLIHCNIFSGILHQIQHWFFLCLFGSKVQIFNIIMLIQILFYQNCKQHVHSRQPYIQWSVILLIFLREID